MRRNGSRKVAQQSTNKYVTVSAYPESAFRNVAQQQPAGRADEVLRSLLVDAGSSPVVPIILRGQCDYHMIVGWGKTS